MKNREIWSVELEAAAWSDDTFNGTFEECLKYCADYDYKLDGKEGRLAKISLDDDGLVEEVLEFYTTE